MNVSEPMQREDTDSGPLRFPPPLIYLWGLAVGIGAELIEPTAQPPTWLRIAAAFVGIAVIALDATAMSRFARAKTPVNPMLPVRAIVTDGPYRFTRNPMYVGMAVLYVAIAVVAGLLWALAILPIVLIVVDRFVIAREERYLAARFGEEYERYRARVRRWI
jgi:protein-S-isoprenylcysteine O-methyltransferase Ste14